MFPVFLILFALKNERVMIFKNFLTFLMVLIFSNNVWATSKNNQTQEKPDSFKEFFLNSKERKDVYFNGHYFIKQNKHTLEFWRSKNQVLRKTDNNIEIYANHEGVGPDFNLVILNPKKHIRTTINRNNLIKLGSFSDWDDYAINLKHPKGKYLIKANVKLLKKVDKPLISCNWYVIEEGAKKDFICWSSLAQLPIIILDNQYNPEFIIDKINFDLIKKSTFDSNKSGFIENNANEDISGD